MTSDDDAFLIYIRIMVTCSPGWSRWTYRRAPLTESGGEDPQRRLTEVIIETIMR